jgi:hypothetical protein
VNEAKKIPARFQLRGSYFSGFSMIPKRWSIPRSYPGGLGEGSGKLVQFDSDGASGFATGGLTAFSRRPCLIIMREHA